MTAAPAPTTPLLEVQHLRKFFPVRKGFSRRVVAEVRAVDDVSFEVREGETLGLVGESGCGKTTTARCILRAMAPSSGEILFRTRAGSVVDLARLSRKELRPLRPEIQMVFQDPFGSLNPRMTLLDNVGEPLLVNGLRDRRARRDRVAELLRLVGMRPEFMYRFPHAFSGGQRQRIGIARALATEPRLVVADEPVSALDVSVQAQVLNLLLELQQRLHLTYLFVAHDLGVVRHICDRVAVMYVGQLVEMAPGDRALPSAPASVHRRAHEGGPGAGSARPERRRGAPGRGRRTPPARPPAATSIPAARSRSTCAGPSRPRFARWRPGTSRAATGRTSSCSRASGSSTCPLVTRHDRAPRHRPPRLDTPLVRHPARRDHRPRARGRADRADCPLTRGFERRARRWPRRRYR